jgi:uncharacterized protein YukE
MTELVYNESHMNDIADKYCKCADIAETIITSLKAANGVVSNNYQGQGKEIALDAFYKLTEHLDYLRICCENTAAYVSSALQAMQEKDSKMFTVAR